MVKNHIGRSLGVYIYIHIHRYIYSYSFIYSKIFINIFRHIFIDIFNDIHPYISRYIQIIQILLIIYSWMFPYIHRYSDIYSSIYSHIFIDILIVLKICIIARCRDHHPTNKRFSRLEPKRKRLKPKRKLRRLRKKVCNNISILYLNMSEYLMNIWWGLLNKFEYLIRYIWIYPHIDLIIWSDYLIWIYLNIVVYKCRTCGEPKAGHVCPISGFRSNTTQVTLTLTRDNELLQPKAKYKTLMSRPWTIEHPDHMNN